MPKELNYQFVEPKNRNWDFSLHTSFKVPLTFSMHISSVEGIEDGTFLRHSGSFKVAKLCTIEEAQQNISELLDRYIVELNKIRGNMRLFDELQIGSKVLGREAITDVCWDKLEVVKKDEKIIQLKDTLTGYIIESNEEEINQGLFFTRLEDSPKP